MKLEDAHKKYAEAVEKRAEELGRRSTLIPDNWEGIHIDLRSWWRKLIDRILLDPRGFGIVIFNFFLSAHEFNFGILGFHTLKNEGNYLLKAKLCYRQSFNICFLFFVRIDISLQEKPITQIKRAVNYHEDFYYQGWTINYMGLWIYYYPNCEFVSIVHKTKLFRIRGFHLFLEKFWEKLIK